MLTSEHRTKQLEGTKTEKFVRERSGALINTVAPQVDDIERERNELAARVADLEQRLVQLIGISYEEK